MLDRKSIKKEARKTLKNHYLLLVTACLLAVLLGTEYPGSLNTLTTSSFVQETVETGTNKIGLYHSGDLLMEVLGEGLFSKIKIGNSISYDENGQISQIGEIELGRQKGVLSSLVNLISSGQIFVIIYQTVDSLAHSQGLSAIALILLSAAALLAIIFFIRNIFKVAYHRLFLESYRYDTVKVSRYLFLFRVKRVIKATSAIFTTALLQFVWSLTIVGGFVVHYTYKMVPYIVAENPDISGSEARKLSKRMVYGHKMDLFKLDLSFIGLRLLGRLSFGLTDILYTNPYQECSNMQYYFCLRDLAKQNKISYAQLMNDTYLQEKADYPTVEQAYKDVIDIMTDEIEVRDLRHTGFRGFVENTLGIIWKYDEDEDAYNVAIEQEEKIHEYRQILNLKQYPDRLSPLKEYQEESSLDRLHYLRHYSLSSLVVMFFVFCFIGYCWEVMLHIVESGTFVNRGVLHGPWLPIYGSGAILILTLLFSMREKPFLHSLMTMILCGLVEYGTHWCLEYFFAAKWWDYSGYFINLHGRICLEGLLVFMAGGMAVVYILAPLFDDFLRKRKKSSKIMICILLLLLFGYDLFYSLHQPNTGKGISDYETVNNNIRI